MELLFVLIIVGGAAALALLVSKPRSLADALARVSITVIFGLVLLALLGSAS